MSWGEVAQLLAAVAALAAAFGTWHNGRQGRENGRKIDAVHQSTNGLSERNEAIARKLGVEEGKASEKANPS